MKPATEALRTGQWAREPAFVIGGGPSLVGFDFSRLRDFHTVGINAALKTCPEIWYAGDDWLIEMLLADEFLTLMSGDTIRLVHESLRESGKNYLGCHYLKTANSRIPWGRTMEDGVCGANNSGVIAINLADILGADPIFLLGFDARPTPGLNTLEHWHDLYPPEKRINAEAACGKFLGSFRKHARYCRAKVFNCSMESALEMFPKITIDEALASCTTSAH